MGPDLHVESIEVGGSGDCLFHSVAYILEQMLMGSTVSSRHVLRRVPCVAFESSRSLVAHLRALCAHKIGKWEWSELLNFLLLAAMRELLQKQGTVGAWLEGWSPMELLTRHNLQCLLQAEAIQTVEFLTHNENFDVRIACTYATSDVSNPRFEK